MKFFCQTLASHVLIHLMMMFTAVGLVGAQLGQIVSRKNLPEMDRTLSRLGLMDKKDGVKHQENEAEAQSDEVIVIPVESSFIACINGSFLLSEVTYLNLTQVKLDDNYKWEESEASACYIFCKSSLPSRFISVQAEFHQSTQSCGCHDRVEEEINIEQDQGLCDVIPGFLRIYCGPLNLDCFNGASATQKIDQSFFWIILIIFNIAKYELTPML